MAADHQASVCYRALLIAFGLLQPAISQIIQDQPELCGKPDSNVEVPANITATLGDGKYELRLQLRDKTVTIEMAGVEKLQEVCPLENGRVLVFGLLNYPNAHVVYLIDANAGTELDSLTVSSPAVSPDQHWLAARAWVPAFSSSIGSEQYFLYDLTKDAAGNKLPGVDYRFVERLGRVMFPVTANRAPFEDYRSPEQGHSFAGGAFYCAPDSKSVVFLDRDPEGVSLILVRVGASDLRTYTYRLKDGDCTASPFRPQFGMASDNSAPDVRIGFDGSCALNLSAHDFKLAPIEVHKPRPKRPSVEDKKQ
jgi:hypothetical protein